MLHGSRQEVRCEGRAQQRAAWRPPDAAKQTRLHRCASCRYIGPSGDAKTITVAVDGLEDLDCPAVVDSSNWANTERGYNDKSVSTRQGVADR